MCACVDVCVCTSMWGKEVLCVPYMESRKHQLASSVVLHHTVHVCLLYAHVCVWHVRSKVSVTDPIQSLPRPSDRDYQCS